MNGPCIVDLSVVFRPYFYTAFPVEASGFSSLILQLIGETRHFSRGLGHSFSFSEVGKGVHLLSKNARSGIGFVRSFSISSDCRR